MNASLRTVVRLKKILKANDSLFTVEFLRTTAEGKRELANPCPWHKSPLLTLFTQDNIYNRLRFLNKYVMFLEELNKLFRENWSKFLTAGYLVFCKHFPAAGYLDTSLKK